jgi:MarR family transcriptional regulator, organic hydroperoxide resistance regulator
MLANDLKAPPRGKQQPSSFPVESSVGYQVRMANRALQRYRQTLVGPFGITTGMWFFLRVLWEKDGLTQRELSNRVGTREPTALVALRAMQKARLVKRVRNGSDKRKVNIFLTAKGRALQKQLLPLAVHVVDTALKGFSPLETRQLSSMLKRIQKNLAKFDRAQVDDI